MHNMSIGLELLPSSGWLSLLCARYIKQHISPRGERAQCPLQMRLMLVPVLLGQGLVQACAFPVASSGIQYMQNVGTQPSPSLLSPSHACADKPAPPLVHAQ